MRATFSCGRRVLSPLRYPCSPPGRPYSKANYDSITWKLQTPPISCPCSSVRPTDCILNLLFLPGALQLIFRSTSPVHVTKDQKRKLKCIFKGWPPPRVVWKKDGQPIINGSQGFYHTEKKLAETDQHVTLQSTLHFPPFREEYEGYYSCIAGNNITGWSSEQSSTSQVIFECKWSSLFSC